jgi:hypothetical protein
MLESSNASGEGVEITGCEVSHTVGVAVDAGVGARNFVEHLVGVTLVVSLSIGGAMACG